MRAFVKLREMLGAEKVLAGKLTELESRVETHDEHIVALFEAIRQLMEPPPEAKKQMGSLWRANLEAARRGFSALEF